MRRPSLRYLGSGILVAGAIVAWVLVSGREGHNSPATDVSSSRGDDLATRPVPTAVNLAIRPRPYGSAGEPVAPESAPVPSSLPVVIRGRVVDERRRPAADVSVELVTDGHHPPAVRTGPDGRFQIEAGPAAAVPSLRGAVVATDGNGRVAGRGLSGEPSGTGVIDVGTLALEQGGLLAVRVLADGVGVAGAQVYIGETEWLGFGPLVTDARGLIAPRWMPLGSFVVRAFSEDRALRGESPIALPRKSEFPLDVVLAPARRLLVTVQDAATGRPVEGETLVVEREIRTGDRSVSCFYEPMAGRIPPTDAAGRTVIVGLAPGRVVVKVLPPGPPQGWMMGDAEEAGRAVAEAGTEELVIKLREAGETFTFPIVSDETEGPPDGAEVLLSVPVGYAGAPPPRKGKVAGRTLVIDGVTPRCPNILAIAADGTFAIVSVLDEAWETKVGSEARFKRRRALVVAVRDRAGMPLVGYRVRCRNVGNRSMGPVAAIGSGGTARIEGLDAESFTVRLWRPTSDESFAREVGAVDLTQPGEGYLEVIAERERSCVLHVTVNGEKRLPASFHVHVEGGDIGPIEEDPEAATLRFAARPVPGADALSLSLGAKGCVPVDLWLPLPEGDGVVEGNVAFVGGGSVRIHVLPPTDNIHDVSLEVAAAESWYPVAWWPSEGEIGHKPTELSFVGLDPGRFRARDTMTGLVSDPFSVAAGSAVEITLDLTHAGAIQGRVEGPADKDLEPATVVISGSGIFQPGDRLGFRLGVPVPVNSGFTARVPGDRAVTFRVTHPVLVPAQESGSVTVTAPGASVVLKLVRP